MLLANFLALRFIRDYRYTQLFQDCKMFSPTKTTPSAQLWATLWRCHTNFRPMLIVYINPKVLLEYSSTILYTNQKGGLGDINIYTFKRRNHLGSRQCDKTIISQNWAELYKFSLNVTATYSSGFVKGKLQKCNASPKQLRSLFAVFSFTKPETVMRLITENSTSLHIQRFNEQGIRGRLSV